MKSALPAIGLVVSLLTTGPLYADERPPVAPASTPDPVAVAPAEAPPAATTTSAETLYDPTVKVSKPKEQWYGGYTLLGDVTWLLLCPITVGTIGIKGSAIPIGMVVVGYLAVPLIVHGAHERWGTATVGFVLRLAIPTLGGLIGSGRSGGGFLGREEGALYGVLLGMLTAMIVDTSVLSYEKIPKPEAKLTTKPANITWYPTGGPHKEGGFTLGLGGTF